MLALLAAVAGGDPELHVGAGVQRRRQPGRVAMSVSNSCATSDVRLHRAFAEISAVVDAELEHDLLDRGEAAVRAGVGGVGGAERRAAAEAQTERRVEVRLVPQLPARAVGAGVAAVQAVPRAEVDAHALQPAVTGYAAMPRSTAGHVAKPVEFCRIPRNMYWFRKSIEPVIVSAPGFGSAAGASCAHAGVLARINVHAARQGQCVLPYSRHREHPFLRD